MATCKHCDCFFHACMSCGIWYDWEWEYHQFCWKRSEERKLLLWSVKDKLEMTDEEKRAYLDTVDNAEHDASIYERANAIYEIRESLHKRYLKEGEK